MSGGAPPASRPSRWSWQRKLALACFAMLTLPIALIACFVDVKVTVLIVAIGFGLPALMLGAALFGERLPANPAWYPRMRRVNLAFCAIAAISLIVFSWISSSVWEIDRYWRNLPLLLNLLWLSLPRQVLPPARAKGTSTAGGAAPAAAAPAPAHLPP